MPRTLTSFRGPHCNSAVGKVHELQSLWTQCPPWDVRAGSEVSSLSFTLLICGPFPLALSPLSGSDPPMAPGYPGPLIHGICMAMGSWWSLGRKVNDKLWAASKDPERGSLPAQLLRPDHWPARCRMGTMGELSAETDSCLVGGVCACVPRPQTPVRGPRRKLNTVLLHSGLPSHGGQPWFVHPQDPMGYRVWSWQPRALEGEPCYTLCGEPQHPE